MTRISISLGDDNLRRFQNQIGALGDKAPPALARAINRTVDMVYTQTVRSLVRQTAAPRAIVVASLRKRYASTSGGALEGAVQARGKELPLKLFKPKQFKAGTKATVWGKRQMFTGAFIYAGNYKSGKLVSGGHVFRNTRGFNSKSGRNNKIEKMFGPSIPKEMVKDETAAQFQAIAPPILARRVEHELGRLLR